MIGEQAATHVVDDLFNRGVLGTVCVLLLLTIGVLCLVIRALFNKLEERGKYQTDITAQVARALVEASQSAEESNKVYVTVRETLTSRGQAVDELSHQVELLNEKMQHGFGNVSQSLSSLANLLEREFMGERRRSRGAA